MERRANPAARERPGSIGFDDRGNAVYQWSDSRLAADGDEGEIRRNRALSHAGLSLMDDTPATNAPVFLNTKGAKQGYDPYQSGQLVRRPPKKKRDMRQLSKWIAARKKLVADQD